MTRDDIIKMATDAGLYSGNPRTPGTENMIVNRLQRFAALVAAAEREECAALMEKQHSWISNVAASAAIRACSEKGTTA